MSKRINIIAALTATVALPHLVLAETHKTSVDCGQVYTVVSGDTLSGISLRAYGKFAFENLYNANIDVIGSNPNLIFVGQQLMVPCASDVVAADTPAATPVSAEKKAEVAASESDPVTLVFNKASAPKFPINTGIVDLYLAEITEVTDGRVQFVDPPEMNRDAQAQLDLVTSGAVDGAYVFNGHLEASHPLLQLPMLPLMGGSAEQTALSFWRLHDTYLAQTDYFSEAKLLGFIAAPAAHIWRLSDEPVTLNANIADMNNYAIPYFEGLDTRGPEAVRKENDTILMTYDEATNGTLTFFMAHGAARAAGVWTEDRTVTEVDNGMYTPTFSIVLSNDAWARIAPADQDAIEAISGDRLAARSASWDAFDNGHRQFMLDTGLNVVKADDALLAELEGVLAERVKTWIADADALGVPGAEAVASYRDNLAALEDRLIFR